MFLLSDYQYHIPDELIAQEAIHPHHDARMMVIDRQRGSLIAESTFWDLDTFLGEDRVLFFNDSKVLRSRVFLQNTTYKKTDGTESTLAEGEIFFLKKINGTHFEALVRPGNKFKNGVVLAIGEFILFVQEQTESGRIFSLTKIGDFGIASSDLIAEFLEKYGTLPLPPYIEYRKEKEVDYQTHFAKHEGSVAAPTASLHFTPELLSKIRNPQEYLTLHVGLGTFKGIQTSDVRDYVIHRESIQIEQELLSRIALLKSAGKKIVAVGTTAMRTLESLPYLWKKLENYQKKSFDADTCKYWDTLVVDIDPQNWIHEIQSTQNEISFETSIYVTPGYTFRIVDDLITNFHLGESSLLVLVSAFLGFENTRKIYDHAISERYRFYSFGDGMYIRGI